MKNKIYLSSINYQLAGQLLDLVGGDNNLYRVLDAILFCWQNSAYQDNGKKVACPKLSRLAELANMSVSSIKRQMKKLKDLGFIGTKIKKVYNGSTRCFFWVCDKVVSIISTPKQTVKKVTPSSTPVSGKSESINLSYSASSLWSTPIYKVNTIKIKNNNKGNAKKESTNQKKEIDSKAVNQVKNDVIVNFDNDKYLIKKHLTRRQVSLVTGMLDNLINQGIKISNPKEIKKQIIYKIEKKHPSAGGSNLRHQINAAAKLIRDGKWTTPFGFYKYSNYKNTISSYHDKDNTPLDKNKKSEKQVRHFTEKKAKHVESLNADNERIKESIITTAKRNLNRKRNNNIQDSRCDYLKNNINKYQKALNNQRSEESKIALRGLIDKLKTELNSVILEAPL